jgi:hypothetical protein
MALVSAPAAHPMQATRPNHLVLVKDQAFTQAKQPIRLTRRGRRVLALLSILPILLVFLLIGTNRVEASDGSADQVTSKVVVQPGQSLWDLALSVDPKEDPRKTIWLIQQLNGMTSSEVLAGQELTVPTSN